MTLTMEPRTNPAFFPIDGCQCVVMGGSGAYDYLTDGVIISSTSNRQHRFEMKTGKRLSCWANSILVSYNSAFSLMKGPNGNTRYMIKYDIK